MQNISHTFEHILREGNQLADYLANRALDRGDATFIDFISLDREARRIVNNDKLQSPCFRVSP